jgi:Zn-dependent metalloprotease
VILKILKRKDGYKLVYRVYLPQSLEKNYYYFIDAQIGEVLGHFNDIRYATKATAYNFSPTEGGLVDVELSNFHSDAGDESSEFYNRLYGDYVISYNCDKENPRYIEYQGGVRVAYCNYILDAEGQQDGEDLIFDYEPEQPDRSSDTFSTVNAYYHVNVVHDYFKNTFGFTGMDFPMVSIANLHQVDFNTGDYERLRPYDNAFYSSAGDTSRFYLGIEGDAIAFGHGSEGVDYSYDADVIYHEYTHAVVGKTAGLGHFGFDLYGMSAEPGSMNEGYADYFSSTITNDPLVGSYMSTDRDLNNSLKCPDDVRGESHMDSRFFSAALWEIRKELGKEISDQIVFESMSTLATESTMDDARVATEEKAKELDNSYGDIVNEKFANHGLIDCNRAIPYTRRIDMLFIPGTEYVNASNIAATNQFKVTLTENIKSIRINFTSIDYSQSNGQPEAPNGKFVFKKDEPVKYLTGRHDAEFEADVTFSGGGGRYGGYSASLLVSGGCFIPGDWYLQFINYSTGSIHQNFTIELLPEQSDGEMYEVCAHNICSPEIPNGYCEDDSQGCIDGQCVNNCSSENLSGYCADGKNCIDGECIYACSSEHKEGYCEDSSMECINGDCLNRCSEDYKDGYCADDKICVGGDCKTACSNITPLGYCSDEAKSCFYGECDYACSAEYTDGLCRNDKECIDGTCLNICSKENSDGYCAGDKECSSDGVCKAKSSSSSSGCSIDNNYSQNSSNALIYLLILALSFIFVLRRKRVE